ncbi:hypothetical protein J7E38_18650 [Bacillus sp. ISL-35]|uniref:hypothetical protein n=1 Tax=Bacillus sp. ISL-35 TaxID=2819122 RepID=UPI001BED2DFB|nr:hypothetical protein [Bacillus sp. ISL-35]MBT2681014.1 hypothetical protein [Bacillus sp. ISL-35]MBT2705333.1 hypothetical protein [Chryseobacterium sp. ISL-80]
MADHREKYLWLVLTVVFSLFSFHFFSYETTIACFLSGLLVSSKCLVDDFIRFHEDDE